MTKLALTALSAALALGLATAASANEQKPQPTPSSPNTSMAPATATPTFDSLDSDKDGTVAKTEVPTGHELAINFTQFDLNGDAKLSRSEFDSYALGEEEEEAE